ncbi:glycosyltransferase involved in cell wall biosynthesis [Pseudoduganella lurida]|uniref:Glycosyltransferase involved in cell wall biosynthesis n=1 Tax=Pseudoduganella lurida TaxID=1036180 RepID=A0A562QVI2_9BURK|nr:glycosyltransferase [Pseudoduganella lurida]TWI60653.1 glycosyltransferase involved in cell wall biosynthesis [Pseudoduganella lurida]
MTTRTLDLGCTGLPQNPFHAEEVCGTAAVARPADGVAAADLQRDALPYADCSFDYLSGFDVLARLPRLVHLPAPRNAFVELMNEAWRVLKPGGHFFVLVPGPGPAMQADPAIVNMINEHTFPLYFGRAATKTPGFRGAFEVLRQEWRNDGRGEQLCAVLRKVEPGPAPVAHTGLVSVVIPVYNGARYIGQTLDSVLAQTHRELEVLVIDDGSSDGSHALLEEYGRNDPRVRVLRTPANLGTAPRVLNFALPHVRGDYFVYSSQDDLFSADWLAAMHARAVATGADAVVPDVVLHYPADPALDRVLSGLRGDRDVELSGRDAAAHSLDWSIPGNALWRAGLVKFFGFKEFGLNSDEYSARLLFINANKVVFSGGTFYYRQDNAAAVTKRFTYRSFDFAYTQLRLYQLLAAEGYPADVLQREALKALSTRNQLQAWLDGPEGASFTADERAAAQQRLDRVTRGMRPDPMFAAVL